MITEQEEVPIIAKRSAMAISNNMTTNQRQHHTKIGFEKRPSTVRWFVWLLLSMGTKSAAFCFIPLPKTKTEWVAATTTTTTTGRSGYFPPLFLAKRNRKRPEEGDLDRWYEDVDDGASPDDIFWEEMERQRLLNQLPNNSNNNGNNDDPMDDGSRLSGTATTMYANAVNKKRGFVGSVTTNGNGNMMMGGSGGTNNAADISMGIAAGMMMDGGPNGGGGAGETAVPVMDRKSAESTLQEFSAFAVQDNWLDDDLVAFMNSKDKDDENFSKNARPLDEQLEEWEQEDDSLSTGAGTAAWSSQSNDEPWDHWGDADDGQDSDIDENTRETMSKLNNNIDTEYRLNGEDEEQDRLDTELEEEDFEKRIADITIRSWRVEKARNSPKAADYFASLEPNAIEGFDQMWVSAIDNACINNLMGTFRNYGVQFADNFGDWEDGRMEDGIKYTIEDIASFKARQVYEVTGLPCIASRTSFEIEPIPSKTQSQLGRPGASDNPRVLSGYRFNDIGPHVDYMCEALRLFSEPTRVTRFRSCLCYYDGEMELFDYGVADVDIYFANSIRTFIPMAQAINEIMKKLQLTFGLEYQKWLRQHMDETMGAYGKASLKLRDRVLKEGKVLPNDIIDVSSFMDSKVDVNLMDDCAQELSKRFVDLRPTKILTVATTGLVIALPMAKYLQVPVVYARKERSVVMADTFQAGYSSKTVGKNRELLVSTNHIGEGERILVVDDFLSSGAVQEALLRIVSEAGAEAVGVGVLLEKVYESGRQSLSGFGISVESLCRVASVKGGVIQLVEEDGYDNM